MTDRNVPWYIHSVRRIYSPNCEAGLPDGSYVKAVAEPYTAGRLKAAWWVLTGRAYAFRWPEPGDIEIALGIEPPPRKPWPIQKQATSSSSP